MCFGHCNFLTKPKNMAEETKNEEVKKEETTQKKVVDGKTYTIHMPSDPAEDNMCDGCQ